MTPMIDVVFLLIIFFLVSSHLAKRETRMPLDLPTAGSYRTPDPANQRLTLQITADGRVQAGATLVAPEQIAVLLAGHRRDHGPNAAVRIRTDKFATYGTIEPLLRDIAAAGIVDITFAVREDR